MSTTGSQTNGQKSSASDPPSSKRAPQVTLSSGAYRPTPITGWNSGWTEFVEYATRETCSSRPGNARVLDGPHRVDRSASGQDSEFRLWTELIQQSCGELHVFLTLLDPGIDGVIHRLTDGAYIPVQVKIRTTSRDVMLGI